MPLKRRTSKTRPHAITASAISAYQSGDWMGLHQALALKPWHPSPLAVGAAPDARLSEFQRANWHLAADLRAELDRASASLDGIGD